MGECACASGVPLLCVPEQRRDCVCATLTRQVEGGGWSVRLESIGQSIGIG